MTIPPPKTAPARPAVWVVDDSPTEAQMALRALEQSYEVTIFNDGSALIERVAEGPPPPDVLVLDWLMPGLSGIEIIEFLRSRPKTAMLPVLMVTAQGGTAQIVEGLSAGANDYLAKPYSPAELSARIGALLRGSALRARADEAEAMLRAVLAQIPDAVMTIGADGQLLFANQQAASALGRPAEELVGKQLGDLAPDLHLDALLTDTKSPLADVLLGGRIFAPRVNMLATGGQATLALRDVTETRRIEARKLDFYSMVAHEMRSPLSALLMRTQLLMRGARGEIAAPVNAELAKMSGQIRALVGLINDFLAISQLESEGFRMEAARVDMAEVAASAIGVYQPLADAKSITLVSEAPLGMCIVRGDPRRLEQVLANLISNSIKYTPMEGTASVRLSLDGDQVVTTVADTGMGIPESALAGLFQKWTRVPGGSERVEGSGLGLVIVREIVEGHGGTVGVESTPGRGSRFWFKLPLAGEPPAAVGP